MGRRTSLARSHASPYRRKAMPSPSWWPNLKDRLRLPPPRQQRGDQREVENHQPGDEPWRPEGKRVTAALIRRHDDRAELGRAWNHNRSGRARPSRRPVLIENHARVGGAWVDRERQL